MDDDEGALGFDDGAAVAQTPETLDTKAADFEIDPAVGLEDPGPEAASEAITEPGVALDFGGEPLELDDDATASASEGGGLEERDDESAEEPLEFELDDSAAAPEPEEDPEDEQPEPRPEQDEEKMSREDAERLLNAVQTDELKVLQQLQDQDEESEGVVVDDW